MRFQFQCGAIGRKIPSKKVELEERFNSSVVRLEAELHGRSNYFLFVSIPVWCDWKTDHKPMILTDSSFNSSVVRLEERNISLAFMALVSFNSSVVRLEV